MTHQNKNIQILNNLIQPESPHDREVLEGLWASLPDDPKICWYPSAGLCVRDLLVWRSSGLDQDFSEPALFSDIDYLEFGNHQHAHADRLARTKVAFASSSTFVWYSTVAMGWHLKKACDTVPDYRQQMIQMWHDQTQPDIMLHLYEVRSRV